MLSLPAYVGAQFCVTHTAYSSSQLQGKFFKTCVLMFKNFFQQATHREIFFFSTLKVKAISTLKIRTI